MIVWLSKADYYTVFLYGVKLYFKLFFTLSIMLLLLYVSACNIIALCGGYYIGKSGGVKGVLIKNMKIMRFFDKFSYFLIKLTD